MTRPEGSGEGQRQPEAARETPDDPEDLAMGNAESALVNVAPRSGGRRHSPAQSGRWVVEGAAQGEVAARLWQAAGGGGGGVRGGSPCSHPPAKPLASRATSCRRSW